MKHFSITLIALGLVAILLGACVPVTAPPATSEATAVATSEPTAVATEPPAQAQTGTGIANPASENCVAQGGTLTITTRGDGGQYGICYFEDNRQCEEWAMLRGDCPVGGLKVTGYVTPAATYCAITGGEYAVTGNSGQEDEQGTCTFKNGTTCDVWAYYNGQCTAQ